MRDLTVILSDVYGLPELPRETAPALATIRRYGTRRELGRGWRSWVAGRCNRPDLGALAPAAVAGMLLESPAEGPLYLATPVHFDAALDHLRLGRGGILALEPEETAALAAEFATVFTGAGVTLHPLPRGGWLLAGLDGATPETADPARALGGDIAPFLPRGPRARALNALGAELQMWLHGHALNRRRASRGQATLSGLWLWGGASGPVPSGPQPLPRGFGDDPFLQGLWRASGATLERSEAALAIFDAHADADLAPPRGADSGRQAGLATQALVVEFALFREGATFRDIPDFDRRWLGAALAALRRGELGGLDLVAGEACHRLVRPDLWKFWRRPGAATGLAERPS